MKSKKIIGVMTALMMFLNFPFHVSAGVQTGGFTTGKLSYRVEYDGNFASVSTIQNYVQKWNGISTKVALTYTTSYASSQIAVIYMTYVNSNPNVLGITHYYYNGSEVNNTATRNGAVCYIYKGTHTSPNTSAAKTVAYATCVHEVGHALSLSHSDSSKDVMYSANISVTTPSSSDKSYLNSKWGN